MTYDEALPFLKANHQAVAVTFRRDGAAQTSIVTCGPYRGGVAFTTTGDRAKLANLRRDSRCTILVSRRDWSAYITVEGRAEVLWTGRTGPE